MFGKPGPSRLLSPFSRQEPSGHPNDSSRTSASPTPGIKITASPTLIEGTICRDHDRSAQSLLGSLLEPPITSAATPSSIGSGARESKNGSSFRSSISARFWRSPSPGPNQGNKSSVSHLEQPIPATPLQSYPDESRPSSSLSTSDIKIDIPRATPGSNAASSNPANFRAQLKRVGVELDDSLLEPTKSSSASASDMKKKFIKGSRGVLLAAAFGLKVIPVPYLDKVTDLLLGLLEVYESVDGNEENLRGLDDDIRTAYTDILVPLQMWEDQIPSEIESLVKALHSDLEKQSGQIELLKSQNLLQKILSADVTQNISDVRACINKAIASFSAGTQLLALLNAIKSSTQSLLDKLGHVAAEHIYVTSKSKCHPETRKEMQESLLYHLREAKNRFVWLCGSPGTGKTAICLSITSVLKEQGTLAASFFWDKNQKGSGLDSIERFPSTLAHQLARFNNAFKRSLIKRLKRADLEFIHKLPLKEQIKALIIEPMSDLKELLSSSGDRFFIILDGLDECGSQEVLEALMKLVLALHELPAPFAILVSSRPDLEVELAWTEALDLGHPVTSEDMDKIPKRETLSTIRHMVEEGLEDRIQQSKWKPSEAELNSFASACRELTIIASIRIRDVRSRTRRGVTLKSEFKYFCNLVDAPADVNEEYLRILQRAYFPGVPPEIAKSYREVPPEIAKKYRGVTPETARKYRDIVGSIIIAHESLSAQDMWRLMKITKLEAHAILEPISSIVNFPSENTGSPNFYHATAKEFITGRPIGDELDEVFFVDDPKGHFLGLPLLRSFNDRCQKGVFGIPTNPPLGDQNKWDNFLRKRRDRPRLVNYEINNLLFHLDPSQLFSEQPNELQKEFNDFLTQNFLAFIVLSPVGTEVPSELLQPSTNRISTELLKEVGKANHFRVQFTPWHLYRSLLPFAPPSSPLYKLYGHFSDPVRIFSASGEFSSRTIPLSDEALSARGLMEAKLSPLPEMGVWDNEWVNYEAELRELDVRNGVVTCAALSRDGHHIALAFGSGIVEIADIDQQRTVTRFECDPPRLLIWVEFVHDNHRIATEDSEGNITIFSRDIRAMRLSTLPSGRYPPVTAVSDNGLLIARIQQDLGRNWYDYMSLLYVSDDLSVQPLASPPSDTSTPSSQPDSKLAIPHRRTIGFSPGARYVAAFDGISACVWSTESREFIARYHVTALEYWILNPGTAPLCPYSISDPMSTGPALPLRDDTVDVETDSGLNADESWIKRPFYDLLPSMREVMHNDVRSFATGRTPLLQSVGMTSGIWFNGERELVVPGNYQPIQNNAKSRVSWYGDRVPDDLTYSYRPSSSRDGTRFLLQGRTKAPIVVDISEVV